VLSENDSNGSPMSSQADSTPDDLPGTRLELLVVRGGGVLLVATLVVGAAGLALSAALVLAVRVGLSLVLVGVLVSLNIARVSDLLTARVRQAGLGPVPAAPA
jgi:hypothetical protein